MYDIVSQLLKKGLGICLVWRKDNFSLVKMVITHELCTEVPNLCSDKLNWDIGEFLSSSSDKRAARLVRAGDKDPCSERAACFANGSKSLVCGRHCGQDRGQVVYANLACDNFSLSRESESSLSQHSLLRLKFTQTQLGPAYDTLMSKLTTLLWRWNHSFY